MRSIRLSLLAYFLVLLALGLGAFSFFMHESSSQRFELIYRSTESMLSDKNARTQAVLEEIYNTSEQTQRANFDDMLLRRAQTLASHLARQSRNPFERRMRARATGQVTVGCLACLAQASGPSPLVFHLNWRMPDIASPEISLALRRSMKLTSGELRFSEDVMTPRDAQIVDYFQILNEQGECLIASKSLSETSLQLGRADRDLKLFDSQCHDVVLPGNRPVRQVTLKAPVVLMTFNQEWPERPGGPRRQRTLLYPIDPKEIERGEAAVVLIQYARAPTEVDDVLNELRSDIDRTRIDLKHDLFATLHDLDHQARTTQATLRTRLLLISLASFALTVLGGILVVHRVLRPVDRLTQAVSQVSERDFELRINPTEVPEELVPIVKKLKVSLESLAKAFEREKQAAADISHELRTPISSLLATIQVCLRKPRTSDEYRTALQNCGEIGHQLNVLVERLLMLARIDAGADKVRPELVDVPDLAEQCVTMLRPLAEAHELQLGMVRNGPIVIETDAEKLREILTNLLHNAIQYNRPQGRIDLSVARENAHVQVEVRDTGIGISAPARARLFERFYRADPSRSSDTVHAGLGLAIVKGYLDLMGGKIEVESVEGKGSLFRILLPAATGLAE